MNWIEKVKYLIERKQQKRTSKSDDKFFYDVYPEKNEWQPGELETLHQTHPYLQQSYLDFIAEFDGISVAFCRFYGSEHGKAISLKEIFDEEAASCLAAGFFPFGRDPGGSNYIFDKAGKVYVWDKWDYQFEEEPKLIADSLDAFVEDCLMGKRYVEFNKIEEDNYYPFLQSMKWS